MSKPTVFEIHGIPDRGVIDPDLLEAGVFALEREDYELDSSAMSRHSTWTKRLFKLWMDTERNLAAQTARAEKAERSRDQFTNWWTGAKQEFGKWQEEVRAMLFDAGFRNVDLIHALRDCIKQSQLHARITQSQAAELRVQQIELKGYRAANTGTDWHA